MGVVELEDLRSSGEGPAFAEGEGVPRRDPVRPAHQGRCFLAGQDSTRLRGSGRSWPGDPWSVLGLVVHLLLPTLCCVRPSMSSSVISGSTHHYCRLRSGHGSRDGMSVTPHPRARRTPPPNPDLCWVACAR